MVAFSLVSLLMVLSVSHCVSAFELTGQYCVNLGGAGLIMEPADSTNTMMNVSVWTIDDPNPYQCNSPMKYYPDNGTIMFDGSQRNCFEGNLLNETYATFDWITDIIHCGYMYLNKPMCWLSDKENLANSNN